MGFIYLINKNDTNLYKIGVTKNEVKKRLKQLQTGSSEELILVENYKTDFYFKIERMLHRLYNNKHIHGEWFELNDEEVLDFLSVCKKYDGICEILEKENSYW